MLTFLPLLIVLFQNACHFFTIEGCLPEVKIQSHKLQEIEIYQFDLPLSVRAFEKHMQKCWDTSLFFTNFKVTNDSITCLVDFCNFKQVKSLFQISLLTEENLEKIKNRLQRVHFEYQMHISNINFYIPDYSVTLNWVPSKVAYAQSDGRSYAHFLRENKLSESTTFPYSPSAPQTPAPSPATLTTSQGQTASLESSACNVLCYKCGGIASALEPRLNETAKNNVIKLVRTLKAQKYSVSLEDLAHKIANTKLIAE